MNIWALIGAIILLAFGVDALVTRHADVIFSSYMALDGSSALLMGASYIFASSYVALEWVSKGVHEGHAWAHKAANYLLFLASVLFVLGVCNQVLGVLRPF